MVGTKGRRLCLGCRLAWATLVKTTHNLIKLDKTVVVTAEHALCIADAALGGRQDTFCGGQALLGEFDSSSDLLTPRVQRVEAPMVAQTQSRRRSSHRR